MHRTSVSHSNAAECFCIPGRKDGLRFRGARLLPHCHPMWLFLRLTGEVFMKLPAKRPNKHVCKVDV